MSINNPVSNPGAPASPGGSSRVPIFEVQGFAEKGPQPSAKFYEEDAMMKSMAQCFPCCCCPCLNYMEEKPIPRHKFVAFSSVQQKVTLCCCCPCDDAFIFFTTTETNAYGMRGKDYHMQMKGQHAKSFEDDRLKAMDWVYGPIASLADKADLMSLTVGDGISEATRLTLPMDEYVPSALSISRGTDFAGDPQFTIKGEDVSCPCCCATDYTTASFFPTYLEALVGRRLCNGDFKQTSIPIPRYQITDFSIATQWNICCKPIKYVNLQIGMKQNVFGRAVPNWITFVTENDVDVDFIQQYVHGAMSGTMGKKLHAANHLIHNGIAKKIDLSLDLNKSDGADAGAPAAAK